MAADQNRAMNGPDRTASVVRLESRGDPAVLRPGDKLVVSVAADVTPEWVAEFKTKLADRLPYVETVVVAGAEQMLVYRPDATDG